MLTNNQSEYVISAWYVISHCVDEPVGVQSICATLSIAGFSIA